MDREATRAKLVSARRGSYNPWLHLLIPGGFGVAVILAALSTIRELQPVELLVIPFVFLLSNAVEWRAHRDLLHKRNRLAPILYDRHTPQHHMIFVTEDMAARSRDEWRFVLIPAFGLFLIALGNFPISAVLYFLISPNVAALYLANALAYVLMYEWLHLSYHLPPHSPIGRLSVVRFLRRHHASHHDPVLMQRWNFNVTVPLWDLVRGTYATPHRSPSVEKEAVVRPRNG
jgi:hypothetical protein